MASVSYLNPFTSYANGSNAWANPNRFTDTGTVSTPNTSWSPAPSSGGSVLGASTSSGGGGGNSGGGSSGGGGGDNGGGGGQPAQPSWQDIMRGNIENAYGNYENKLNDIYNTIPGQADNQRGIINNQYQQGVNTLGDQFSSGNVDLNAQETKTEASQAKSMKELAEAMRNQFMSGQVMLGARGAGDSSAVDQYSYALTKLGNQQRGDLTTNTAGIISEIDDRRFKLKNTYDAETRNIALERDSQLNSVAQWLSEQQNTIRQLQAEGGLRKGQDLNALAMNAYNEAMNRANQINTAAENRRGMLEQWAANNASNIQQLQANMQGISGYTANPMAFQGLNGGFSGGGQGQQTTGRYGGYAGNDEEQRGIFG